MTADYILGFVQRDGNMVDDVAYGTNLKAAVDMLRWHREHSNPHHIHWYVYDADDPERGYFDEVPED